MNYKNINDYEVLYFASEDMDTSYDILSQKYSPIIKSIAKRYASFVQHHGGEYQDLIQEGYLGLNQAIISYQDHLNTIFYTYACICIERNMNTYCRSLGAKKHQVLNHCLPDDNYSCSCVEDTSFSGTFYKSSSKDLLKTIFSKLYFLDLDTRCVFLLKYNGFTYREISQLLAISLSTVDSKIAKARNYLKKCLENYELN